MKIRLNEISEGIEDAIVTIWYVEENKEVSKGQDLFEISADKATFDVQSPCDGILIKVDKKEGENIKKDEVIAEII